MADTDSKMTSKILDFKSHKLNDEIIMSDEDPDSEMSVMATKSILKKPQKNADSKAIRKGVRFNSSVSTKVVEKHEEEESDSDENSSDENSRDGNEGQLLQDSHISLILIFH